MTSKQTCAMKNNPSRFGAKIEETEEYDSEVCQCSMEESHCRWSDFGKTRGDETTLSLVIQCKLNNFEWMGGENCNTLLAMFFSCLIMCN